MSDTEHPALKFDLISIWQGAQELPSLFQYFIRVIKAPGPVSASEVTPSQDCFKLSEVARIPEMPFVSLRVSAATSRIAQHFKQRY